MALCPETAFIKNEADESTVPSEPIIPALINFFSILSADNLIDFSDTVIVSTSLLSLAAFSNSAYLFTSSI